jgi:hypothetical protein
MATIPSRASDWATGITARLPEAILFNQNLSQNKNNNHNH